MHHFLFKISHFQYLLLSALLVLAGCKKQEAQPELPLNAALGYPSQASKVYDYKIAERFLVEKPEYSLCYSGPDAAALWVAWHLQKSDLGNAERQDDFRMDPEATFAIVKPSDFTGTGFDRGHLCPSGDRTSSQAANSATFLMNNIIAQSPSLNRGVWNDLEEYCRKRVKEGNEAYIYAGGNGKGGWGTNPTTMYTGISLSYYEGRFSMTVYESCWKVALILPEGSDDLNRISKETVEVIAFNMPNSMEVAGTSWQKWKLSVRELEGLTGLDFFSALNKSVQDKLEK